MSIDAAKTIFDVTSHVYERWRKYEDPVRKQAIRFLTAFEAHSIARQQIIRILPNEMVICPTKFSDANSLKEELSPKLLDWAAGYLALDRSWLDGVSDRPHQNVDGYKNETIYSDWLERRINENPSANRILCIWASKNPSTTHKLMGFLAIVYIESDIGLDGNELSRYWTLSNQWPLDHRPCINSMLELVRISRTLNILTVGRIVDHKVLSRFENGHLLAPPAKSMGGKIWYPEDLPCAATTA